MFLGVRYIIFILSAQCATLAVLVFPLPRSVWRKIHGYAFIDTKPSIRLARHVLRGFLMYATIFLRIMDCELIVQLTIALPFSIQYTFSSSHSFASYTFLSSPTDMVTQIGGIIMAKKQSKINSPYGWTFRTRSFTSVDLSLCSAWNDLLLSGFTFFVSLVLRRVLYIVLSHLKLQQQLKDVTDKEDVDAGRCTQDLSSGLCFARCSMIEHC